jgi:GT2 family glycosyltransferase
MFCAATGLAAVCSFSPFWNSEAIGGWDRRDIRDVGVVTGCFAMISKALWDSLGGFDERFFIYSEDTDLSIRVTELGKRCVLLGTVEVIHYGGQSDSIRAQKIMRIFAARIQFMHKHRGGFVAGLARRILYLHTLVRVAGYGITGSVRPARRHFFHTWLDVWRTRHRWLQGDSHVVTPASG